MKKLQLHALREKILIYTNGVTLLERYSTRKGHMYMHQ